MTEKAKEQVEPVGHWSDEPEGRDGNPVPASYIIWIKPGGLPKQFNTIVDAEKEALRFATDHPGTVVGLYQLVGWSHATPRPAEYHEVGADFRRLIAGEGSGVEEAREVPE